MLAPFKVLASLPDCGFLCLFLWIISRLHALQTIDYSSLEGLRRAYRGSVTRSCDDLVSNTDQLMVSRTEDTKEVIESLDEAFNVFFKP